MTLDNITSELTYTLALMKANALVAGTIILSLWLIYLLNSLLGKRLILLGIYPRTITGLIGIPFFSFLHGDLNHLFFNSIPLFILICFVLVGGMQKFILITWLIILISGLGVWLFGRRAIHIGASCLVMGYWGYLLADAYQHPSVGTLFIGGLCVFYFGGLLLNLFPGEEQVSWEGHILGFLAGIAVDLLLIYF